MLHTKPELKCVTIKLVLQNSKKSTCTYIIQLISEHSVLHVREIYALDNVMFYIAVYGPYKHGIRNVQMHLKPTALKLSVTRGSFTHTRVLTQIQPGFASSVNASTHIYWWIGTWFATRSELNLV